MRQWLLLSDVHLETAPHPEREEAVRAALTSHPGVNVAFLGDLFEFAASPARNPDDAVAELLAANPSFCDALRAHAASGAQIHWVSGNHDAASAGVQATARAILGVDVTIWPWFFRVGDVHLEHGHVFDRDNAPLHPLATYDHRDEPLGVALMRKIVVELDARQWAHAHQTTPLQALRQAAAWFGWGLAARLFRGLMALTGLTWAAVAGRWGRASKAETLGASRVVAYAEAQGVRAEALFTVLGQRPVPTHSAYWLVFRRLYLDWVAAVVAVLAGLVLAGVTGRTWPWAAVVVGGVYAAREGLLRRESRYPPPLEALSAGAQLVAHSTAAKRVVFGHTHVEEQAGPYTNLGSFGYPSARGRAYGLVTEEGAFTRLYLP